MMKKDPSHSMYFVAVLCPESLNEKLLSFKRWMQDRFGCQVALKSPAHITLVPPFWYEEKKEKELSNAIQAFNTVRPGVEIFLDGFSHFRKRVLFVQVEENPELEDWKKQAEELFIEKTGGIVKKEERPFHPHVTIATRDMKPSHFNEAWEHFSNKELNECFSAKGITLLKLLEGRWEILTS